MMRLLVTGFGPFGPHDVNPASVLAENSGERFAILPVSYRAAQEFIADLDPESFDAWLMIGVHGGAKCHHRETVARNRAGTVPDIEGFVSGPGPLDPMGPWQVSGTLWSTLDWTESAGHDWTVDAGDYLCNALFYYGVRAFPEKKLGFLHIPPFSVIPQSEQQAMLAEVIEEIKFAQAPRTKR